MAILTVFLDRCENLVDMDVIGKSDPYVKFELKQTGTLSAKGFGEAKSSWKKDTLSPVYGETFTFKIPDDVGLHNVVLNVKVMDKDLLMDDKMGGTTINLEPLGLSETPSLVNAVVDKKSFLFSSGSRDGAGCVYRCQKAICSAVQVVPKIILFLRGVAFVTRLYCVPPPSTTANDEERK